MVAESEVAYPGWKVASKEPESPRLPKSPTVKLDADFFAALWWVARIEDRKPGEILEEIAGAQIGARFKRYEPAVAKLRRSDLEQEQTTTEARQRGAGSR